MFETTRLCLQRSVNWFRRNSATAERLLNQLEQGEEPFDAQLTRRERRVMHALAEVGLVQSRHHHRSGEAQKYWQGDQGVIEAWREEDARRVHDRLDAERALASLGHPGVRP